MNKYKKTREIEENLENPNDKQVCDWLEKNTDILHEYFNKITEAHEYFDKITETFIDDDFYFMLPYYRVFKLIYGLFNRLTSTPKNAKIIHYIFAGLSDVLIDEFTHKLVEDKNEINEISDLLKKWRNKKNIKHEDYLYFYEHQNDYDTTCDDKFTKIQTEMEIEEHYIICRFYLVRTYNYSVYNYNYNTNVFKEFENSDDVALRMAYYKENNFNWSNEDYLTEEKLKAYYEKDGRLALDYIIDNQTIYFRNEHLKLIIRNAGHIPTLNRIMENYNKVQKKKEPWELARELVEKIEKKELEEKRLKKLESELESALIEIHNRITNLNNTVFNTAFIGLIILFIVSIIL